MENIFYIKQGASLPELVMRVNRDNRFTYEKFQKALENCAITFSMVDTETNILKIAKQPGGLIAYEPEIKTLENEYYVYYKFSPKDTNRPGKYKAEFKIDFFDTAQTDMTGSFIAPIHSDLYVIIVKSLFTEVNKTGTITNVDDGIFSNAFLSPFD